VIGLAHSPFTGLGATAPRAYGPALSVLVTHCYGVSEQVGHVGPSEWKVVHNALVTGLIAN
jgi:hypothetical protein